MELSIQTVLVMNPDYGSRLQLQKIVMLDLADIVVVNKSDLAARANCAHAKSSSVSSKIVRPAVALAKRRDQHWSIRSQNGTATLAWIDCLI